MVPYFLLTWFSSPPSVRSPVFRLNCTRAIQSIPKAAGNWYFLHSLNRFPDVFFSPVLKSRTALEDENERLMQGWLRQTAPSLLDWAKLVFLLASMRVFPLRKVLLLRKSNAPLNRRGGRELLRRGPRARAVANLTLYIMQDIHFCQEPCEVSKLHVGWILARFQSARESTKTVPVDEHDALLKEPMPFPGYW